jgi:hypothetical protein
MSRAGWNQMECRVPGSGPVSDGVFKRLNGRFKERGE